MATASAAIVVLTPQKTLFKFLAGVSTIFAAVAVATAFGLLY
jgi:hypothetical protein